MELDYLRREAGLTIPKTLELLGISERTWRRWNRTKAPTWAPRLLRFYAGYLDELGWKRWQIRDGDLYCGDLHHCYRWNPGDLIASLVIRDQSKNNN